ncbi:MAG: hypothetical protein LBU61_01195 [Coriobacteriales bacterium]|jgi:hypothetical protein|nr:hypothetical protein [Coriobacteriales bacterium]
MKRKIFYIIAISLSFMLAISSLFNWQHIVLADQASYNEAGETEYDYCYTIYHDEGCIVVYGKGEADTETLTVMALQMIGVPFNPDYVPESGIICCNDMRLTTITSELHVYSPPLPAPCVYNRYHIQYCMNCGAIHSTRLIGDPYNHTHTN